jgi:metastasis-associated protein MTA
MVNAMSSLVSSTGPVLCRDEMEEWSAAEANLFEEALDKYGKNFREIQQDLLPWKSLKSVIEYYYMWKTTDRYVQQKRIKAAEAERKLKQVYIPPYNKANPAQILEKQNGPDVARPCESCFTVRANQWFAWGPPHMACRLCGSCWTYWKKYGGLKRPASRSSASQDRDGVADSQQASAKIQRCTLPGCGKEFRTKAQLVRHLTDTHGFMVPAHATGTDSPVLSVSGSAVKTRAAFCLVTTPLTRLSRQLCKNVLNVHRSARRPFHSINIAAIKQECQQRLPELLKKVRQLKARKRIPMVLVSARLGIDVHVDKPALLHRPPTSDVKRPVKYAFPAAPNYQQVMPGGAVNRKRGHEHVNGTEGTPTAKRHASEPVESSQSIKLTEPKMRGSAMNVINGAVSASRLAGMLRGRKHASVSADSLDDVCFKATDAYRKQRKQQITIQAMRRGARKPWRAVTVLQTDAPSSSTASLKCNSTVDNNVILLD